MTNDDTLLDDIIIKINEPNVGIKYVTKKYPPASPDLITEAERELGFSLHPFLKRIYNEVANGGFGPGAGMLGLRNGHHNGYLDFDEGHTMVEMYRLMGNGQLFLPRTVVPLWEWGCSIWSGVDTDPSGEARIFTYDDDEKIYVTKFTIHTWLKSWLSGVDLFTEIQPRILSLHI